MKNRNVFLFLCGLALMLTMYNCQRVSEPLPTAPNADLLKGFTAIKMPAVDLAKPEPVVSTPSALLPAAVKLDFNNGMVGSDGQPSAEARKATDALNKSFSAGEIDLMSNLDPSVINNLLKGAELPENLSKVVKRAETSSDFSVYLRKPVLATVEEIKPTPEVKIKEGGITDPNARTGASSTCKAQAQAAYQDKLAQLRDERRQQLAAADLQNKQDIANATAAALTCKTNISYDDERANAVATADAAIQAILNSNFSNQQKRQYLAIVRISLVQALNAINRMEADDRRICDQIKRIAIVAADNILRANQRTIEANFDAAVENAKAERAVFIANCEYQQGQGV